MGPSTYSRVAEITSGRAITQQGLTDNLQRPRAQGGNSRRAEGFGPAHGLVGAMKEASLFEATREVVPTRGNTPGGQRSPGHWGGQRAGTVGGHDRDRPVQPPARRAIMVANVEARRETDWPVHYRTHRCPTLGASRSSRRGGRQTIGTRGVRGSALKLPHRWAGRLSDKLVCRAQVRTGLGKSDRPGSQGGFENRDQSRQWRVGARAQFRARQPHARIEGGWGNGSALRTPRP